MCWQLCATFSFPPNWQQKKLDSIFYQLLRCSYILSRSQGCQFLSSNLEKRFIFWEGDDTRAPPACSPSIPALVSWKSCFQFHTASMGWELGSVDSGQSVMGCSLETHPFSSTPKKEKLQQKIPKEDHKKKTITLCCWVCFCNSRTTAETAVLLSCKRETTTWKVPVGSMACWASTFPRPHSRDLHLPVKKFKLPPDAQMKLQGRGTHLTLWWKQCGCKDGEGDLLLIRMIAFWAFLRATPLDTTCW